MRRDFGTPKARDTRYYPHVGDTVITTPFADPEFGILTRMEIITEGTFNDGFTTSSGRHFEKSGCNWISDHPTAEIAGDRVLLMLKATDENKKLYTESRYDSEKRYFLQTMDWETLVRSLTDKETHILFTTMKQIESLRNEKAGDHVFPRLQALPSDRVPVATPASAPILTLPVQWHYFLVDDLPSLVPDNSAHVVKTDSGLFLAVAATDPDSEIPMTRTVVVKERIILGWIAAGVLSEGVNNPDPSRDRKFSPVETETDDQTDNQIESETESELNPDLASYV